MRLPQVGAAVLGVPVKPTIKEADAGGRVVKTLKRAQLWEVQTPQVTCSCHMFVAPVAVCGISLRCIPVSAIGTTRNLWAVT